MATLEKIKNATSEALQRYSIVLEYKEALEKEQSEIEALKNQSKSAPSFALDKEIMERGKALPGFRNRLVTLARESKGDIKNLALNLYYIQQKVDLEAGEIMNVSKTTFFRYLKLALAELADLLTHAEKEN